MRNQSFLLFQPASDETVSLLDDILDQDVDKVENLLEYGQFSLEDIPTLPENPLVLACRAKGAKAERIVELLLAHVAHKIQDEMLVKMSFQACTWSGLSMVKLLEGHAANISSATNYHGDNLFHAAGKNFDHGADIMSYFLDHHNLYEHLWAKNLEGFEPQSEFQRMTCKNLQEIALNGRDFNNCTKVPTFAYKCSSRKFCPMRLAEKIFSLLNYQLQGYVMMGLEHHETENRLLANLTEETQIQLTMQFSLLDQEIIFGKKTALEFLMANRRQTNIFAKNIDAVNDFLANRPSNFFKGLIKSKLIKSQKRLELFERAREKFIMVITETYIPELAFYKISVFLTNLDLINIVDEN